MEPNTNSAESLTSSAMPNPQPAPECAQVDLSAARRRLDCAMTAECLWVAIDANWPALDCRSCSAYVRQGQPERESDQAGLLALAWVATAPEQPHRHRRQHRG
jgi:hypothetical protein